MDCKRAISLIHEYFDGDLEGHAFKRLDAHLQNCPACSKHFRQMEKTEALVRSLPDAEPSDELTERIMAAVPKPKKQTVWLSWARRHPALSAAMVFLVVMLGSLFSLWDEEALVVKGDDLEPIRIQGKTVIVPEGEVLKGNLVVENGQIQVDGEVRGNLVVIDGSVQMASTAKISGEVIPVNRTLDWLWYKINQWFSKIRMSFA